MPTREAMESLANDIVSSYEDRVRGIAQLQGEVAAMLKEAQSSRATQAQELRADLTRGAAGLRNDVDAMLKETQAERATRGRVLRADLARGAAGLRNDVDAMLKETQAERAARGRVLRADLRRSVSTLLEGFDTELDEVRTALAGARDAWQEISVTMQARRGASKEISPEGEAAEITSDLTPVRNKVFEHLANHPDGTRMVELEQEFRLPRISMARVIRSLTEENKVEKRGLLYFAI